MTRRQFLVLGGGIASAAVGALLSIPAAGFLLSPLFSRQREAWVRVGFVDDIPAGAPVARIVEMPIGEGFPVPPQPRVVYVSRRDDGSVLTLSNICSHMQCDVHWDEKLDQFLCPCHGGLYDAQGKNIGGPPPSPLPRWVQRVTVDASGRRVLEVANRLEDPV